MKVALMQPYFFPYTGYFQLIHAVDEFVVFDSAQYIRRGWINRNRILNAQKETTYINIPIHKAPLETRIKDIQINNSIDWRAIIFNQLNHYRKAPNYDFATGFLYESLNINTCTLSEFNIHLLREICSLLEIKTNITVLSEQFPTIHEAYAADEWGIKVAKALNASTYINAIGGKNLYSQQKYKANKLDLQFINPVLKPYKQFNDNFISGLSILDVMMFNNLEEIKEMLEIHELIK